MISIMQLGFKEVMIASSYGANFSREARSHCPSLEDLDSHGRRDIF